jgi:predicted O-methyltransferase YrrM
MLEKIRTAAWFVKRPLYWAHAVELVKRKFRDSKDRAEDSQEAVAWAAARAVTVGQALAHLGLVVAGQSIPEMDKGMIAEANKLASGSKTPMGGPGDLELLHAAVKLSKAKRVVETGVAFGWSSLAILTALNQEGQLVSVDMPYPKLNNEDFVGIVVPERLRTPWSLVREPDRNGLRRAIQFVGGELDLCHYDSDKSWWGRQYGFNLLWNALRSGGVFISDDIQDNMAFAVFVKEHNVPFAVTASSGKYVGIARKP